METTLNKRLSWRLSERAKRIIVDVICYLFFTLFIYSAVDKLFDFGRFQLQLGLSPMLTSYAYYVALGVPTLEIAIAVLVILPGTLNAGLHASFSLMVMFTTYIFIIMNYSEYVPCSCNGILEGATWNQHLIFNVAFVLLALTGIILQNGIKTKN